MACRYTYQNKIYEAHEFDDVLRAMSPAEASKYMPTVKSMPSAPMVSKTEAWVGLALKHAIMHAASNGYDKVAFINGEQSTELYREALIKAVDVVTMFKSPDGKYDFHAKKDGASVLVEQGVSVSRIEAVFGKAGGQLIEAANSKPGQDVNVRAKNMTVGGEGMRAFYDTLVPQVANDVLRRLGGGKMGGVEFSQSSEYRAIQSDSEGGGEVVDKSGNTISFHNTAEQARTEARKLNGGKLGVAPSTNPGFDITPIMREKMGEGVPLFSPARDTTRGMKNLKLNPAKFNVQSAFESHGGNGDIDESTDITAKSQAFADMAESAGYTVAGRGDKYVVVTKPLGKDADGYDVDVAIKVRISDHSNVNRGIHFGDTDINLAPDDGYDRDTFDSALRKLQSAYMNEDGDTVIPEEGVPLFSPARNVETQELTAAVKKVYKGKDLWRILLDESTAESGPFDGGCLICAQAIIQAHGSGELVRIVNGDVTPNTTDHYGAKIDGVIMDFGGAYTTPKAWIKKFESLENLKDRQRFVGNGKDASSEIPEDAAASSKIAGLISDAKLSTARNQTDTPAFKTFFGDSVVTDTGKAGGVPLVVYHGTRQTFTVFKKGDIGFHFGTMTQAQARTDAATNKQSDVNLMSVYLSLKNPVELNDMQDSWNDPQEVADALVSWGHFTEDEMEPFVSGESSISKLRGWLLDHGVDGFVYRNDVEGDEYASSYIALKPNQIKSAIGNNGNFDPTSNNITESKFREQTLLNGYRVSDFLDSSKQISWWDKTVGTPYHLAQKQPEFKRVFDAVQNFIGDVSRYANRAADMAPNMLPKLENLKDVFKSPLSAEDVQALSGPIFQGTLSYTRDKDGNAVLTDDVGLAGVVWRDEEMTQMFGLSEPQIKLYREFRKATNKSINDLATSDMIKYAGKDGDGVRDAMLNAPNAKQAGLLLEDHLTMLAAQNPDRADVLQNTARVINLKAGEAQGLIAKGYAPLTRYGDYTVYVTRGEGDGLEQIFFGMYETDREANKAARMLALEYPDAKVDTGTMSKEAHKQFQGVTPETMALLGEALGLEEDANNPRSQMFQEMLKLSKSTRSAMKRLIERKGVDGYSDDAGRVLAGFVYSNARQSSQNLNAGEIAKSAAAIPKEMGDLKDHAIRLAEYSQQPQEEAAAARALLFIQFIGGSVASALINATQSIAVTWPTLSQYFGVGRSGAALTSAMTIVKNGAGSDADLAAAMKRAQDEGVTDPMETHQLMAQSQGRGSLKSGDGTKLGDTLAKMGNSMAKAQLVWGKGFGFAETLNRKLAFVAAYKLAREKGMADPYAFAKKIVSDSQFVLNKGSNPVWARGAVGATLFTFKKYGIFYLENLARMYGNGPEGKKAFALSLAIMFVLAGAGGFPFADDLDDIIDGFAQRVLNKSFSSKQAKKEFFIKILGEAGAEFVTTGVSGLPGVPIDISGRLGMGNLLPGTGFLVKKSSYARDAGEIFGAAGAFATRLLTGTGQLAQGDVKGAAESVVPIAIANMIKAVEMFNTGVYKDAKGRKVIDVTATEALLKAIGFQPASVKNVQDATMVQQGLIALNKIRESEIADIWTRGRVEKKPELIEKARQQLADWNRENPDSPIKIDGSQINRRVQQANMDKATRITKTAPKEIRQAVKETLEREINRD